MGDQTEVAESKSEGAEGAAQATPPPPPQFATMTDFQALRAQTDAMRTQNEQLQSMIAQQGQILQAALVGAGRQQAVSEPDITDEALNQAFAEGTLGKTLKQWREGIERKIEREKIAPLRAEAAQVFADLNLRVVKGEMPYYGQFQKEIDTQLANLAPEYRANPATIKLVHDAVVGANVGRVLEADREKASRQARDQGATLQPGSGKGTQEKVPSPEDLFGPYSEQMKAVEAKGGADAFAKRLGHKDWETWYKDSWMKYGRGAKPAAKEAAKSQKNGGNRG